MLDVVHNKKKPMTLNSCHLYVRAKILRKEGDKNKNQGWVLGLERDQRLVREGLPDLVPEHS